MNFNRKVTWLLFLFFLSAAGFFIHSHLKNEVILKSFSELEIAEAEKNMARVIDALGQEIIHLDKLASDWAIWDDTYRFSKDLNKDYIQSNLEMDTLESASNINLVYILSPHGEKIWGKIFSTPKGGEIDIDEFTGQALLRFRDSLDPDVLESKKEGLLVTDKGTLVLSVRKILTSRGVGPSAGIFIMGRFMSGNMVKSLRDNTRVNFSVTSIKPGNISADEEYILGDLKTKRAVIRIDDVKTISAFGMLPDIFGKPAILIHATMPREIMEKGRNAARYVSFFLLVAAFLALFFFLFVMKVNTQDERRRTAKVEALVEQRTTELKQANIETEQARVQAVEANKAKSEFLANMSHEIRTPLNGIIGMTEIAMTTIQNEKQRDVFETISREALSLLVIINNILDFSKIEARKVEIENIPFDLKLLVNDIGKSVTFLAERKGLTCIVDIDSSVPVHVKGDPGRIRQILMNLAGNALKFTHDGGVVIRCEPVKDHGKSCEIRFSVIDTGIGIPKEKQAKIFESFIQVDGSTTRKYGGTGLGITISKQLAEFMGGSMGVDSDIGKGSTFWFTAVMTRQSAHESRPVQKNIDHVSVLVVGGSEDEPLTHNKHLKGLGCRTVTVMTGAAALSRLKDPAAAGEFNLIVMDYLLADTDGFTLAGDIRSMDDLKHIPIILTTRVGNIGDGRKCEDIGIQCYLSTPVDPFIFRKAIAVVMGAGKREDGMPQGLVTRHTLAEMFENDIRILLVEDYPTNRQVAVNILKMSGFEVEVAENGQEAVDAFMKNSYSLVFMDVQMPVMDGCEATRIIRGIEEKNKDSAGFKKTPIVAMTANALTSDRDRCLEAGMDDFITKPVTKAILVDTVYKWTTSGGFTSPGVVDAHEDETDTPGAPDGDMPLNYSKALSEFMGDKEVLMDTLNYFLNSGRSQVVKINKAVSENTVTVVAQEAHKIKGGSANLTMDVLSKAAAELEAMGKAGNLEHAPDQVSKIVVELDRLEVFLSKMVN
jgi:signal transduction histidine kinase/DNA-binding response OmpR family regulator/HPt (histidine-containing phosphotransfer) domain-containing protein